MRLTTGLTVLAVAIASCGPTAPPVVRTTEVTPTVGLPPTTRLAPTTTLPKVVLTLDGAPPALTEAVASLYEFAAGSPVVPPAPEPLIELLRGGGYATRYHNGRATIGKVAKTNVAVVEVGNDLIGAVEKEEAWQIVGARIDSLGIDVYWGRKHWQVLVIGSDARPGQKVLSSRADSIHIVALDGTGHGAVVGIPRDSWVSIPGRGKGKINSSLSLGGPKLMMKTFEQVTDVNLDGYVITGFAGFVDLIGVLGGLDIDIPMRIRDTAAHANLRAGEQTLTGTKALAFSRVRKTLPSGDLTRQKHGGLVLLAALTMVRERGPESLPDLLGAARPFLKTDLDPGELLGFSLAAIDSNPKQLDNLVVSARIGRVGAASVVFLNDAAFDTFADLKDGSLG